MFQRNYFKSKRWGVREHKYLYDVAITLSKLRVKPSFVSSFTAPLPTLGPQIVFMWFVARSFNSALYNQRILKTGNGKRAYWLDLSWNSRKVAELRKIANSWRPRGDLGLTSPPDSFVAETTPPLSGAAHVRTNPERFRTTPQDHLCQDSSSRLNP